MSEFKGTPGPWVVDESRHDGCINRIAPFRHIGMASGYQIKAGDREENEANAKLMAAAPDLLAALIPFLDFADRELDLHGEVIPGLIIEAARKAIAKAIA